MSEHTTEEKDLEDMGFFEEMEKLLEISDGKRDKQEWNQVVTDAYRISQEYAKNARLLERKELREKLGKMNKEHMGQGVYDYTGYNEALADVEKQLL